MAPRLLIEAAKPADIPLLRDLAGRIWRAHYPPIIGAAQTEAMLARMYDAGTIRREMTELGYAWSVVRLDGEAIGYLSWLHEPAAASVKLSKLYLDPARHGSGIGAAMLAHVEREALALGARRIYLFVHKRNAKALRAYERNGFTREADVVTEFGDGFVMDDWRMGKAIQPSSPTASSDG
jgi:GNAT superfamily N-acetyltransferase